jgi:hypothetical protein
MGGNCSARARHVAGAPWPVIRPGQPSLRDWVGPSAVAQRGSPGLVSPLPADHERGRGGRGAGFHGRFGGSRRLGGISSGSAPRTGDAVARSSTTVISPTRTGPGLRRQARRAVGGADRPQPQVLRGPSGVAKGPGIPRTPRTGRRGAHRPWCCPGPSPSRPGPMAPHPRACSSAGWKNAMPLNQVRDGLADGPQ